MKATKVIKYIPMIILLSLWGCNATFNSSGKLVVSLKENPTSIVKNVGNSEQLPKPSNFLKDIISQFESVDEGDKAENLTNKAAANCAGGVCTIY